MSKSMSTLRSLLHGIRRIDRKYKKPKVEFTPFVRFSLLILRLYLLVLVGLMIFKFVSAARA